MGLIRFGDSKTAVGIDIGNSSIRIAQLHQSREAPHLTNYGSIGIPRNAITDGEIVDIEAVSSSLKELWRTMGLKKKEVIVGIANQKVIVRLIELPYMDKEDLAGALEFQAQDYIAIPVEEAVLDFEVLRDYITEDERHLMDVLLVAAQKDMVYGFVDAIHGAGLEVDRVDVSAFALVRAVGEPVPVIPGEDYAADVIMDIGYGTTNIIVSEGLEPKFTRITPIAGKAFTDPLIETFHITFDEAERLKLMLGVSDLTEEVSQEQIPNSATPASAAPPQLSSTEVLPEIAEGAVSTKEAVQDSQADTQVDKLQEILNDPLKKQQAQMLIEQKAAQFSEEARRSLDYYLAQSKSAKLQKITLIGVGSRLMNLDRFISNALQMEVVHGNPLKHIVVPDKLQSLIEHDKDASAVSIGLALGGLETL